MKTLLETSREIFSWAKAQAPAGAETEIYLGQGRGRSVVWSERKCEDLSQADGGGVGIRVILKDGSAGRQGFAYTTSLDRSSVEATARRAVDAARHLPPDEFRRLAQPNGAGASIDEKSLNDAQIFEGKITDVMERLAAGEDRLLKQYPLLKSILRAGFSEGSSEVAIVNSNGIERSFSGTHVGLGVSCLAEKEEERQEGGFGLSRRFRKDLDWDSIFDSAAQRTIALLGGRAIPSGNVPVVFDPSVACDFLSLVSGAVCADSIQKGKSFLAGKLNEDVASKLVTLIDDGAMEKGLASAPVDDEGIATRKTAVISNGSLDHFLYDTYTALKDGAKSTGNAGRSGFKSSPSSGPSNFYLAAGSTPRAKLLKGTAGLYLYDVMGLHMADPISGDFSVGVIGAWLEGGEFKYGVRGVTLAGNLLQLLSNIDAVADDLTFFGSQGSPTFRAQDLTVSGS